MRPSEKLIEFYFGLLGKDSSEVLGTKNGINEILAHPWLENKTSNVPLDIESIPMMWNPVKFEQSIDANDPIQRRAISRSQTSLINTGFGLHVQEELRKNKFSKEILIASHSQEVFQRKKTRAKTALKIQRSLLSSLQAIPNATQDEMQDIPNELSEQIQVPSLFFDN